ncbi:MAG: hypothetical protein ABH808_00765, partial [Candidatus Kuenenbacteria bacterium]
MALLINFSKMICGILIDCSQVVMMTFVDGYKQAAAGNFATAFGLDQILTWYGARTEIAAEKDMGYLEVMGALLLALVLVIVAISVTLGIILILLIRIIMLWFLVVLSPLAYLLSAFPGGAKYSQQWWTEFTKYLIVGPAMAFFLWLSLMVMSTADANNNLNKTTGFKNMPSETGKEDFIIGTLETTANLGTSEDLYATVSAVSSSSHLLSYIIAIGMLCGSMIMAQQIGVAGAGMAMNMAKKVGKGIGMGMPAWAARKIAAGKAPLPFGWGKKLTGIQLNPVIYFDVLKEAWKDNAKKEKEIGEAGGKKHFEARGWRGFFLGGGAGKDWAKDNFEGVLYGRGLIRATVEQLTIFKKNRAKKAVENKKAKILSKITAEPTKDEVNKHLERKGFDPLKLNEKGNEEKNKFITDWKLSKAKEQGGFEKDFTEYDELVKKEKEIKRPIKEALSARQTDAVLIREEQNKNTSADEGKLANSFKSALEGGSSKIYEAAGILLRAFETGNENGILEGCNYEESHKGMNDFFNEIIIKQLGMDPQSAYDLQTAASTYAKQNGHFVVTETTKINEETGQTEQRDPEEARYASLLELEKRGTREVLKGSRLGFFTETTNLNTGERKTKIDPMFIAFFKKYWRPISDQLRKEGASPTIMRALADPEKNGGLINLLEMIEKEVGKNPNKDDKDRFGVIEDFIKGRIKASFEPEKVSSNPALDLATLFNITPEEREKYKQPDKVEAFINEPPKFEEKELKQEKKKKLTKEEISKEKIERVKTKIFKEEIEQSTPKDGEQPENTKFEEGLIKAITSAIEQSNLGDIAKNSDELTKTMAQAGKGLGKEIKKVMEEALKDLNGIKIESNPLNMTSLNETDKKIKEEKYYKQMIVILKKLEKSFRNKKQTPIDSIKKDDNK